MNIHEHTFMLPIYIKLFNNMSCSVLFMSYFEKRPTGLYGPVSLSTFAYIFISKIQMLSTLLSFSFIFKFPLYFSATSLTDKIPNP